MIRKILALFVAIFVVLFGILLFGPSSGKARALSETPVPEPVIQVASLEDLSGESSVVTLLAAMDMRPSRLEVNIAKQEGFWAYGFLVMPAEEEGDGPWAVMFLAQRVGPEWRVTLEYTDAFYQMLAESPDTLLGEEVKDFLLIRHESSSSYAPENPGPLGNAAAQLALPWPVGQTWKLTGGPHRNDPNTSSIWSSLDFQGPNGQGVTAAAREGVVFRPCANFVLIKHPDGWETGYYHLSNIRVQSGQYVNRGDGLGDISTASGCGGYATGPHVHFSLRYNGQKQSIIGHDIGGWTVHTYGQPYTGYFVRVRDGYRVERWGWVLNEGAVGSGSLPTTAWIGEYYSTQDLSGPTCAFEFFPEVYMRKLWSANPPSAACPSDFSARYTRVFNFDGGTYKVVCQHDDGCRVYLDGQLIIDAWQNSPFLVHEWQGVIPPGLHEIKIEFFDSGGEAGVLAFWKGPGFLDMDTPCVIDQEWCAAYFSNIGLLGVPWVQRGEPSDFISYQWGSGGPDVGFGFPTETFGARWQRRVYLGNGTYRFYMTIDDGGRVWVDNNLILDEWRFQPVTSFTADITVSAGEHVITFEYFEQLGAAVAQLWWEPLQITPIFQDVPPQHWAWEPVERLYMANITQGCAQTPLLYCPNQAVTRAQMAVFLLRSMYGGNYTPPPVAQSRFADVPASHWAKDWIEQLAVEGITTGCGNGNYCPNAPITRAQMAVFLLRAKYGAGYQPPPVAQSRFHDVPDTFWAKDWIEQLAAEGITTGCGNGAFCPNASVTRDQMAVFLLRTFNP